jgi:hypothetical protein
MENAKAQPNTSLKERLQAYTWQKRVLLVIAPSAANEPFLKQQEILTNQKAGLQDRDMEIIYLPLNNTAQVDQAYLTQKYTLKPDAFYAILIGKDGTEKLRSGTPLETQKLFGTIDSMPMRKQEMRNR